MGKFLAKRCLPLYDSTVPGIRHETLANRRGAVALAVPDVFHEWIELLARHLRTSIASVMACGLVRCIHISRHRSFAHSLGFACHVPRHRFSGVHRRMGPVAEQWSVYRLPEPTWIRLQSGAHLWCWHRILASVSFLCLPLAEVLFFLHLRVALLKTTGLRH